MSRLKVFLNDIHNEYAKARYVYNSNSQRLIRGRSRSISSISEDLFAGLLRKEIKSKKVRIFVDQGISLVGKKQTYYPDIIVCTEIDKNEYEIFFMIDLKTDIGFKRKSIFKIPKKHEKECKKMKSVAELKGKRGDVENEKKKEIKFILNKKTSYDVVIISSASSSRREEKLLQLSKDNKENIWVLSTGRHPNWYQEKKDKQVIANEKDWEKLIKKIKKIIK